MTTRLESDAQVTILKQQPILSPKILQVVSRGFSRSGSRMTARERHIATCYIAGWPVDVDARELRMVLRKFIHPAQVLVLQVSLRTGIGQQLQDNMEDNVRQAVAVAAGGGEHQLFYMGGVSFCLLTFGEAMAMSMSSSLRDSMREQGYDLNIGLGEICRRAEDLPSMYTQATLVARLGQAFWGKRYQYRLHDVSFFAALLPRLAQCPAVVASLGTLSEQLSKPKNLLPTLDLLFEHNLSPSLVARAMRIHRNTVIYRLSKVKQQTGLDPLDFYDALQLRFALATIKMQQSTDLPLVDSVRGVVNGEDDVRIGLLRKAFYSPKLTDNDVRQWASSAGVSLPTDFALYYTGNEIDDDKNTTILCNIAYGEGLHVYIISGSSARLKRRLQQISASGDIGVLVTSKELQGCLSSAGSIISDLLKVGSLVLSPKLYDQNSVGSFAVLANKRSAKGVGRWAQGIFEALSAQPQLLGTAEMLFESGLNLSTAARRLGLHRNTLIYRIGRIKQCTGYDLAVFADAMQLKLALVLAQVDSEAQLAVK